MLDITRIYLFVFAAFTAAGGVMGFVKAGSLPSLIAGGVSGALIAIAGFLLPTKTVPGLVLSLVVSALLLGRFLPAYLKKGVFMPAVPMIALSIIAIVLSVIALVKR